MKTCNELQKVHSLRKDSREIKSVNIMSITEVHKKCVSLYSLLKVSLRSIEPLP